MCGISGLISRNTLTMAQLDQVERVNALLAHRGPDGQGSFEGAHVKLAMRRLSIIDLNAGWQPAPLCIRLLRFHREFDNRERICFRDRKRSRCHGMPEHADRSIAAQQSAHLQMGEAIRISLLERYPVTITSCRAFFTTCSVSCFTSATSVHSSWA